MSQNSRTEIILGQKSLEALRNSTVAIFGLGGVGSGAVEGLARSGVGNFALCDGDVVCESNINRQLIATHRTIGKNKTAVTAERILEINPGAKIEQLCFFYNSESANRIDLSKYTYVIDAIDDIPSKILLIVNAKEANVPIISSMGAGNKIDPTKFEVTDIYQTSVCPLARVMRKNLREKSIDKLKVVYSKEMPIHTSRNLLKMSHEKKDQEPATEKNKDNLTGDCVQNVVEGKKPIGSVSFVPPVAGFILAGEVIKDITYRY